MQFSRYLPAFALRQALILTLAALILGLAANQLNPRGIAIAAAPTGAAAWDDSPTPGYPRPITLDQMQGLMQRRAALLIDARSREEYLDGHLPGALHISFEGWFEQIDRVRALPHERWLVLYCSGGTCDLADLLAGELIREGFEKVAVYRGGIAEYRLANPLERGEEAGRE
ncbi:MAG TPA: rhodanese-like domain-containing protein [bacterium]|nr:rhodanese-like domain-containing protein [bacterium]